MTLNGGNPDAMSLRRFIDVAAAMLAAEFQRTGAHLIDAIEKVNALGMGPAEEKVPDAQANTNAMQTLMAAMSGVQGAPV